MHRFDELVEIGQIGHGQGAARMAGAGGAEHGHDVAADLQGLLRQELGIADEGKRHENRLQKTWI